MSEQLCWLRTHNYNVNSTSKQRCYRIPDGARGEPEATISPHLGPAAHGHRPGHGSKPDFTPGSCVLGGRNGFRFLFNPSECKVGLRGGELQTTSAGMNVHNYTWQSRNILFLSRKLYNEIHQ